jgi:hypothetical protein
MAMMEAFLAGDGSIEFPDERATCRVEQVTGHVFRRFSAQCQQPPRSFLASRQERIAYGLWYKRSGVSLFVLSAISYRS